jgi:DNA-binding transcriptional ArsR family regulator
MALDALTRRLRTLADPLRLRVLHILGQGELTVTELTQVLNCGQPRASSHLARLLEEGLVATRREGRYLFYALVPQGDGDAWAASLLLRAGATKEALVDAEALRGVLARRAGSLPPDTLGRDYLPGRTWEGFARAVLQMLPPRRIADLGIGAGDISLLLARRAERVIGVDHDPRALADLAARAEALGLADRLVLREGDLVDPPIEPHEVDVWLLSQVLHLVAEPARALRAAASRLEPGGTVVVLDLLAHTESWVQARLGHQHMGFTEKDLNRLLEDAGFQDIRIERAARDRKPPHFVSLLAVGRNPT